MDIATPPEFEDKLDRGLLSLKVWVQKIDLFDGQWA